MTFVYSHGCATITTVILEHFCPPNRNPVHISCHLSFPHTPLPSPWQPINYSLTISFSRFWVCGVPIPLAQHLLQTDAFHRMGPAHQRESACAHCAASPGSFTHRGSGNAHLPGCSLRRLHRRHSKIVPVQCLGRMAVLLLQARLRKLFLTLDTFHQTEIQ